jgi:hypothetical protein
VSKQNSLSGVVASANAGDKIRVTFLVAAEGDFGSTRKPHQAVVRLTHKDTGRSVFFTVVSGFQMNLVNILAAIMGANVLERFPNVRIAFGESGSGWIPYALDRMDFEWEDRFTDLGLKMKPSDYWRRQCKAPVPDTAPRCTR